MNTKVINLFKNMSYTIFSNLVSLTVSALITLIIPKLIGVEDYGYFQLYIFYSSYVGFLHLGWNDGIYLRYGGAQYKNLDKNLFFSQFIMLLFSQVVVSCLIFLGSHIIMNDLEKVCIFNKLCICLIITNIRYFFLYILQATNRIKEYATITILDKVIFISVIIIFLLIGNWNYRFMINADLIGRACSLIFAFYYCKDIIIFNTKKLRLSFKETYENIRVGIKLMIANIASMLIVGIVQFGIEHTWSVSTFGKISLSLNISNMIILFINAVGIVIFPILRRTDEKKLSDIYITIRNFLMLILLGILVLYYPIKEVLLNWLPQYYESFRYMALLFPIFIYEGKMALLINTYLKTLREEKTMLKVNILAMFGSVVMTFITTNLIKSLDLAIFSILITLAARTVFAEKKLTCILRVNVKKDIVFELVLTSIFILSSWYINSEVMVLIYGLSYILYICLKKKDIYNMIINIKKLIQNN